MKTLAVKRLVAAPISKVWPVVADVANYADYAPNITSSRVVSGQGRGLLRECSSKEGKWREVCTHWQDYNNYTFTVKTDAPDYPFPFRRLQGEWRTDAITPEQTMVQLVFYYEFANPFSAWLLDPILRVRYKSICRELLDNWERAILAPAG